VDDDIGESTGRQYVACIGETKIDWNDVGGEKCNLAIIG